MDECEWCWVDDVEEQSDIQREQHIMIGYTIGNSEQS
jgi:hypothetical protein